MELFLSIFKGIEMVVTFAAVATVAFVGFCVWYVETFKSR